jgi:hypothetical protein
MTLKSSNKEVEKWKDKWSTAMEFAWKFEDQVVELCLKCLIAYN